MDLNQFYLSRKQKESLLLKDINRSLFASSMLRLVVFILIVLSIYFFWGNTQLLVLSLSVGVGLFLFLITRHQRLENRRDYRKATIAVNQTELNALAGIHGEENGAKYTSANHAYSQDIDLFGEGSIFQRINRTTTVYGEQLLAKWLNDNDITGIEERQKAIQELAEKVDWREHFRATASLSASASELDTRTVLSWLRSYKPFIPAYFKIIPIVFSVLSLVAIALYSTDILSITQLLIVFFGGLGITGTYVKRITSLYNNISKAKDTFAHYSELISAIETADFSSQLLNTHKEKVISNTQSASVLLRKISTEINNLGNRNNILLAPVLNGFFLWDIYYSYKIERWISSFDNTVVEWFEAIEFFDAMGSLANYSFNHPTHVLPKISGSPDNILEATEMKHPLMSPEKCVPNSIHIKKNDFIIITGANMAGKSTFLRTVGLNLVLANCGLPVPATSFTYTPIKLISSMRTSDSLLDDASYFYAELRRLKHIVDQLETAHYFVILDEILKGTNSKDKAEGSAKFLERLVKTGSTGIIATHDLSLCTLADSFPSIRNHYFDAEIVNDELYFDYTFKNGVCQNMNASFLLRKMGIIHP